MKKLYGLITVTALLTTLLGVATPSVVNADTVSQETLSNTKKSTLSLEVQSKIESYVSVKNNQYVLDPSVKNVVTTSEYLEACKILDATNNAVESSGAILNQKTKIGTTSFELEKPSTQLDTRFSGLLSKGKKSKNHKGVTKVVLHWNYARIYLSKSAINAIKGGGLAIAGNFVAKIPHPYARYAAIAVVGVLGSISAKRGVWIDYNYAIGYTKFGYQ